MFFCALYYAHHIAKGLFKCFREHEHSAVKLHTKTTYDQRAFLAKSTGSALKFPRWHIFLGCFMPWIRKKHERATSVRFRTASAIPLCSFLKLFRVFARGTFFVGLRIEIYEIWKNLQFAILLGLKIKIQRLTKIFEHSPRKKLLHLYYAIICRKNFQVSLMLLWEKDIKGLCWQNLRPIRGCIKKLFDTK